MLLFITYNLFCCIKCRRVTSVVVLQRMPFHDPTLSISLSHCLYPEPLPPPTFAQYMHMHELVFFLCEYSFMLQKL